MTNLTRTLAWHSLRAHYQDIVNLHMRDFFLTDPKRRDQFFLSAPGIYLDFAKNRITAKTMELLFDLVRAVDVVPKIEALFTGELVNQSEKIPALHTALRNLTTNTIEVDKQNIMPIIKEMWGKMAVWSQRLRCGQYKGCSGKAIRDVVNIGVGGSDLGPHMLHYALTPYISTNVRCHFISNQDKFHMATLLKDLDPEKTLFIIASKSFTTQETMNNAERAKQWLRQIAKDEMSLAQHLFAVTAHKQKAREYGILPQHVFPLWEWVGGRYSIWSAVGLTLAIAVGMESFKEFLAGAHAMDRHFRNTPVTHNMPIVLAVLAIWYSNFFNAQSWAVIPYSQQLLYLPEYLQQLYMESQGKSVQCDGSPVNYTTGTIVWGGIGSNSQHSFHQLFLQGNQLSPIDFILPLRDNDANSNQYASIANCLSQSEVLMHGYDATQVMRDMGQQNVWQEKMTTLAPHKIIAGNYPSNTIFMECITPYNLGSLLALYEHKVYVQSLIWNINPFDQWGVERGKSIAKKILKKLSQDDLTLESMEPTHELIKKILDLTKELY